VLARNFELPPEEFDERRNGHELSTHSRATATVRMQRTTNDQLRGTLRFRTARRLVRQPPSRQRARHIFVSIHSKQRFHRAFFRAAAKRIRRRSPTGEQRERRQYDRLTRAGLARENVQARPELELDRLDQRSSRTPTRPRMRGALR